LFAAIVAALFFVLGGESDDGSARDTVINRLGRGAAKTLHWAAQTLGVERPPVLHNQPETAGTANRRDGSPEKGYNLVLYGTVLNERKEPIPGVRISVRPSGSSEIAVSCYTDEAGAFSLEAPTDAGSLDILVFHQDYVPLIRRDYSPPANRARERVDFVLPLGATIEGIVWNEDGKPVANASVSVKRRRLEQWTQGGNVFLDDSTYKTTQSDREGTFTLRGIGLGENLFEIRCRGYDLLVENRAIEEPTSKERLKFVLHQSGCIAGLVTDEKDTPLASATVRLTKYKAFGHETRALEGDRFTTTTDSSGAFAFRKLATEGFYDLAVEHPDFAPAFFPLIPPGTLRQVCKLERGATIKGSAVFIDRPTTPAAIAVVAQSLIKETTFTRELKSGADGQFTFTKLPYATYRIYSATPDVASEPLDGIKCDRAKPVQTVVLELYEKCIVRGRVLDAETETPLPNAKVKVECSYGPRQSRRRDFATTTDATGQFEFISVPAGLLRIYATADGYIVGGASAQTFTLLPGERKTDIILRLGRGGIVDGFVYDHLGRSVEGAEVQLFLSATTPRQFDVSKFKVKTDASGYFKLWGIDVGEHVQMYASAQKAGYARARSKLLDLTASKPYASTQIVLMPGARVAGKVTDDQKLPIAEARVEFTSEEFPMDPSYKHQVVQTAADGSYLVENCSPGRCRLKVSKAGFVDGYRSLQLQEGEFKKDVNFELTPGLQITGRVLTLEGKPIANARVRAVPHKYVPGRDETLTDKLGNYVLRNLGRGLFDVRANFPIKTADGEQSYEFFKLDVKAGTTNLDIECDINNTVVGTVEGDDKKPVDRFRLSLHSRRDTKPLQEFYFDLERDFSSARGFFRVLNIPRGIYSMTISADGYEVYQNENLVIGPSRRTVIPRIRLKAAGGVTGFVYSSETDRPINDVVVRLTNPQKTEDEAHRTALTARTDYAGFFRVATAAAGTYVLELEHPNYISARIDQVTVRQRGSTDLGRIYLEAGGSVQGVVVDEAGYGVSWAKVRVSGVYPAKETRTNSFGNYLLLGIRPGRWPLVVEGNAQGRRVYVFRTVGIVAGETREENFQLETSADLIGSILSSQGNLRSGSFHLHPFDEFSNVVEDVRYDGYLGANQQFRIGAVPPGQYFLWATGYGPVSSYALWQTVYLQRGENRIPVELPSGYVGGNALNSTGGAASGVQVQLMPIFDGFGVPRSVYYSLVRKAQTDAGGRFGIDHVMPGMHQLLYFDPGLAGGGQWVALSPFWLGPGQAFTGLNFTLAP
jgi:protocatechuate 3,4-dioxygenase beta subunit